MSVLNYRDEASCPTGNGTTYTSSAGFQYELYCNFDYKGKDLPSTDAKTYSACIDSCDSYSMDESEQDGANCVAAVFGAGDPNGNQCWLKYAIDTVGTGGHMVYAARRVQYQVGSDPVYSAFEPSGASPTSIVEAVGPPPSLTPQPVSPQQTQGPVEANTPGSSSLDQPSPTAASIGPASSATPSQHSTSSPSRPSNSQITAAQPPSTDASTQTAGPVASTVIISSGSVPATTVIITASPSPTIALLASNSASASASAFPSRSPGNSDSNTANSSSPSLSPGAKIGIGVGAAVLFTLLLALFIFLLGLRRRRRRIVAPASGSKLHGSIEKSSAPQAVKFRRGMQELEGDSPPVQELEGSRMSELRPKSGVSGWKWSLG